MNDITSKVDTMLSTFLLVFFVVVVVVVCTIDFLRAGVDVSLLAAFDSSMRRHRL
jgi:hypothetical protein